MDKEAEAEYERRQAEPLFKSAKDMIPMQQVEQHYENLQCGNAKRKGCKIPKNSANQYLCTVCQMLKSLGTDFFEYEKQLTENMLYNMTKWQHEAYNERREYNKTWLDNFSRGA